MNKPRFSVLILLLFPPQWLLAESFDARLQWADVHIVSVPVEGIVSQVAVAPGQRVSAGELLLQLNATPFQYRLQQARAEVDAITPAREDALREKNDAEVLYEQTVLSDVELQAAQIRYRKLDAEWQRARAALKLAQWQAGWTRITAGQDALVIDSSVVPGQMIAGDTRSQPLLRLASANALLATASVPGQRLAAIQPGDAVHVTVAGQRHAAVIERIDWQQPGAGRASVSARFETGQVWLAGQAATLELP